MKVLGVVTARGGSKGIPRKNVLPLCGKPLLQYTAEAALASRRLTRVVLSTDDPEIAEVGYRCGLDVPFLRPPELAGDTSPSLPVVRHAVQQVEAEDDVYEAICLLQPTHPLRRPELIDACIETLEAGEFDAVVTILPIPLVYNPHWAYFRDVDGRLHLSTGEPEPVPRRQDLPPAYHREGSVYVTLRDILMEDQSLYGKRLGGFAVDPTWSVNIDGPEDWERAEALVRAEALLSGNRN
ncbi:acylneuraminate cytidylyltransferase family protein [Singulisphaera sp. Ch08]|uniref:Acylneuraminate cytidylyltransferase family protein n=1 Tax=Singulisphaera sp. Ch08 TaxID=3120278 RepID=A0AAU7CQL7_9BACT